MAATEEMLKLPWTCGLNPSPWSREREERTTEGGLDVVVSRQTPCGAIVTP